jgi:hypothetical protein
VYCWPLACAGVLLLLVMSRWAPAEAAGQDAAPAGQTPANTPANAPAVAPPIAPPTIRGPRDLLDLQGIDQSHFDQLTDGVPWQADENETLLKIMYRLHRDFRPAEVEQWSRGKPEPARLAGDPDASRGEIFALAGRVVSVEICRPAKEAARRFELSEYYRCGFVLADDRQPAVVFAHTIPQAWKKDRPRDARAGALALFLKLGSKTPDQPLPIFVTSRIAWYPPTPLGDLGMDVGLFDDLRPGASADPWEEEQGPRPGTSVGDLRLTARSRECFYQLLSAAGRAEPGALSALAAGELKRTGRDRFSVVPLFNEPLEQQGRLVVLSGTARQVIAIRVSDEDVVSRFGIDHYYEVSLFTEDSQGNPLVFCVRELPEGMPVGEGAEFGEYVTAAGFFFNKWAYRSRRSADPALAEPEWQLAPLLIGRDLKWHPRRSAPASPLLGAIAGGLFVLALLGVWLALWRSSRRDRQFRDEVIARQFAPAPGVSLDEIGLDAREARDGGQPAEAADSGSAGSSPRQRPGTDEAQQHR